MALTTGRESLKRGALVLPALLIACQVASSSERAAVIACNERVLSANSFLLVAPSTAKMQQPDSALYFYLNATGAPLPAGERGRTLAVHTYMEAENRMGVPIRNHYRCVVTRADGAMEWTVVEHREDQMWASTSLRGLLDTLAAPGSPPAAPAPPPDRWFAAEDTSVIDGAVSVSLNLFATEPVRVRGREVAPSLMLRCKDNSTAVVVHADAMLRSDYHSGRTPVRVRVDEEPVKREAWSESTDRQAVFAPRPIAFARRLASADTLFVELTPLDGGAVTAKFALAGLAAHLPRLARACQWAPAP